MSARDRCSRITRAAARQSSLRALLVRPRARGLRDTDVLLASYPKSGNTWLKFLLIHAVTGKAADFDSAEELIPPIGAHAAAPVLAGRGEGRIIKTHEPYSRVYSARTRRALYVARDGRDVAISYFHYEKARRRFAGTFGEFLSVFLAGRWIDGYGAWHRHVLGWLGSAFAGRGDLLVVRYEDMLRDPVGVLGDVMKFVGVRTSAGALRAAVAANTAAEMRQREGTSTLLARQGGGNLRFVRSGTAGDWANVFSDEQRLRFAAEAAEALDALGYER